MEQVKLPFRADIVGSFLRPERLKKARKDFESGLLSPAALQQIEDEEIEKLIAEQKVVGLQVITDGEFRRSWWHLDFFWGLGGIEKKAVGQGYVFHNLETRPESVKVTGKITGYNHPMIAHFRFIQKLAGQAIPKQTIPSPAQLLAELIREGNMDETPESIWPDRRIIRRYSTGLSPGDQWFRCSRMSLSPIRRLHMGYAL